MKYYIPFLICLISLSGFAQSKFWGGVTVGAGNEWYLNKDINEKTKQQIEHIGLAFKYDLSDKLALRTGFNYVNKYFDVFELPLGVEYSVIRNNKIDLVISSGVKISKLTNDQHDYLFSGCRSINNTIFGVLNGLDVKYPTHISFYNGIHGRLLDQFDIGITLNSGFYNFIELRDERFLIQDCSEVKELEKGFMDNPDRIFRNSYLSLNLTYWIRKQDDEKKERLKELGLYRNNFIYAELLGAGWFYSLNYERILITTAKETTNFKFLVRTGLNIYRGDGRGMILYGVGGLVGNKNNFFELGVGHLHNHHPYFNASYRYQKNAFFGRGGIYLIRSDDLDGVFMWPGFSFGVAF